MGCDIHSFVEVKRDGAWCFVEGKEPFDDRNYGVFGFLAGVRNYSRVPQIAERRGFPDDLSQETQKALHYEGVGYSTSWILLSELLAFDYEQSFENRRVTRQIAPRLFDGGATCDEGEGERELLRDFLGDSFFADMNSLELLGDPENVRVVFYFDN